MDSSKQRHRRLARAAVYRLGEEPPDDLSGTTSAEERIAMMWPPALEAWTVAGRALPTYRSNEMPGRLIARPVERPSRDGADRARSSARRTVELIAEHIRPGSE